MRLGKRERRALALAHAIDRARQERVKRAPEPDYRTVQGPSVASSQGRWPIGARMVQGKPKVTAGFKVGKIPEAIHWPQFRLYKPR